MSTKTLKKEVTITSPIDGQVIQSIPLNTQEDLNQSVKRAEIAFETWSKKTLRERAKVFYRYRELLQVHSEELAALIQLENGKTLGEAKAEIDKAIEVTEFACSLPQLAIGEVSEVSQGIHCQMTHEPLGVVANITPFNFPCMVPHWTLAIVMVLGNTLIMKPSEQVPLTMIKIAELLESAGLPQDVFQVLIGEKELVEGLCDHPDIKAISFVGSTKVAGIVYQRASQNLKRVLCLGGAKNHVLVLPDAHPNMTATNIAQSMSGCAGQRCMAASAMVGVGEIDPIINQIVEEAKKIRPGIELGAIISKSAKERIEAAIQEAVDQGAKLILDGRKTSVPGKEKGFYIGPTIVDHVTPEMSIAKEEIFGPVLVIIRSQSVDEAIDIQNQSEYGNGAAVFTQNGKAARYVQSQLSAGMIGINIGVPVPREPFSFGGWNESKYGAGDITGKSSIQFWTQLKKTTTKWNPEDKKDWMS